MRQWLEVVLIDPIEASRRRVPRVRALCSASARAIRPNVVRNESSFSTWAAHWVNTLAAS